MSTQEIRGRAPSRAQVRDDGAVPVSVKAAAALFVLVALSTATYAVLALADGRSMLRDMANSLLSDQLGAAAGAGVDLGPLIDDAVNTEYQVLQGRAYIGIVIALVCLALCVPVMRGARKLRIVATVFVAAPVIMAFVDLGDDTPTVLHAADVAELVCAVLLAVALWLPATNAYVRARRS